ncbi:MAG: PAS domain-containing protein [Candidatus Omnitrophica bacterium]|nr:PAS domain-containing protein [Candidatus Omnitrophota bacterium]
MRLKIRHKIVSLFIPRLLREIGAWARSFAGGDFSRRISLSARDEMEELADPLNSMSRQIQSRMEESIADKSRLEAVFLSMFDGVMVIDGRGEIVLMNQTLKEFLQVDSTVTGKKPLEVIRNIDIQELAERVLISHSRLESREITLLFPEERVLLAHATPVLRAGAIDGAVLVFHDITQLRQLEKVRQDFVANVSHELRTPVSTIRGYAETLLEGALEDKAHAREFLRIIYDDAERLTKLINDLLDLSRIESGKMKLALEECSLEAVVDRVLSGMKKEAQKSSVALKKDIPPRLSRIRIDEAAIAQVLFNLAENAVKYNNAGGSVTIAARETDRGVEVSVTDTGIGIPQEDIPRIFERFYRVDKARSRDLGGTGLGLAIVKHILQAHHGDITAESKMGSGSTFRFTLSKVL